MKALNRSYLVFALLFAFAGIVQWVRWSRFETVTLAHFLNFLPAAVFLIAYVSSREADCRRIVHVIAIPMCLLAVLFTGFLTVGIEILLEATANVTDLQRYEIILNERWRSAEDLVGHFPRSIPAEAEEVRFFFRPAFLQGGAAIQLYCHMPADSIAELYDRFSAMKTKSFFGGCSGDHMNMEEGMPTTSFYTSGSNNDDFSDDFEIMIFDNILKREDRPPGHYWNHAAVHGVAISKKRNVIVYWAERW